MKTAIYINDVATQIVLTPETELEETAISAIMESSTNLFVTRGSFYKSSEGWNKQGTGEESLIIRTRNDK